jgi:hypothetical protein
MAPTTERAKGFTVRRRTLLAGSVGALGLAGAGLLPGVASASSGRYAFPEDREFAVLLTGDAGTGKDAQYAVADAARRIHREHPFGLALGLGDNIYEDGPEGPTDPEFQTKFERPNHDLDMPWLMVQGNHDHSGLIPGDGAWITRGDFEVKYHSRSRRWYMPRRYYSVRVPEHRPVVEFFVIDTNPVASYVPQLMPYWMPHGQYMREQRNWLRNGLANSPAKFRFVCSHHPYISNGAHGNAGRYDGVPGGNPLTDSFSGRFVKQLFEQDVLGKADAILSGHDHTLQVLEPVRGTTQVISGAAAKSVGGKSRESNPACHVDLTGFGFMRLYVTPDRVKLTVHRVDVGSTQSEVTYEQVLAPLRDAA